MKRYIYGITALLMAMLVALALTGCADDVEPFMTEDSGTDCIKLVVSVPMDAAPADDGSRATDPNHPTGGELSNNEFKVKSLHFYFYQGTNPGDDTKSVYDCVWTGEFDTQKTVTVSLPSNALLPGGIFPGNTDTECIVYAVANVDNETILPVGTAKTINELKTTALSSAFDETKVQESFAMDGQATVTVDRSTRIATGEITLQRAAAKITLAIDVPAIKVTNAEGNEVEYTPNTDAMHVWISNGVKNSKLNTAAAPVTEVKDLYSNKIEAVDNNGSKFTYTEEMEKYKYVQNMPFYSYPNKWESDKPEGNCYLTLVVPWTFVENGVTQPITTYYRIPVNPELCTIERNMHYDIRVTIGRLGSTDPQKPIDMTVDWNYAIPWNTHTLATDIKEVRYLLLNQNYYDSSIKNPDGTYGAYSFEMNNTTDIEIPIGTSHETIIESVKLSWYDLLNNTSRQIDLTTNGTYKYSNLADYTDGTAQTVYAGIEVDNTASRLKLNRKMLHIGYIQYKWVPAQWQEYNQTDKKFESVPTTTNTDNWKENDNRRYVVGHYEWEEGSSPVISDNAALNSYTFDIVLRHADDPNRTAKVRITQYPDIYITAQLGDAATRFVNNDYGVWDQTGEGKQYVYQMKDAYGNVIVPAHYAYTSGKKLTYAYTNTQRPEGTQSTNYFYWDYYMGTINLGANKNTYLVNVSKFNNSVTNSETKEYIIGDPRVRVVDNLPRRDSGESAQDKATWSKEDNVGNQLSNYYPTDGTSSRRRFIAPKFRVASQLGITHPIIFDAAKRRCASYQEDGRQAGRWRLPTVAEIEYIATLSSKGFIPYLFGSSDSKPSSYFCGEGFVKVDNRMDNPKVEILDNADDMIEGYVRCVYDEWYWGNDTLTVKNQFTWGDRERSISGN